MQPIQPGRPGRFSFVDEGEAVRRLNVNRETLLELVASKRLRAYPGVGKGNFFRVGDLDRLKEELHPGDGDARRLAHQVTQQRLPLSDRDALRLGGL